MSFGNFLKQQDSVLHSQYSFEKYSEGQPVNITKTVPEVKFEQPVFKTQEERLLDHLLMRLDKLDDSNEAVKFCLDRKIPREKFNQLYYIENVKNIVQLSDKYKESIKGEEPRLVLPFYDGNGQLSGVTCRALRGEALRYITVKVKDGVPLLFGLDTIDKTKTLYLVEGPIDSLFLDNCLAAGGTTFGKIGEIGIDLSNVVMIFDNQPRNKEVCGIISKHIDRGHNVVIWPQTLHEKDINDMVLAGRNVKKIVKENTFGGLTAKTKFIAWKRC